MQYGPLTESSWAYVIGHAQISMCRMLMHSHKHHKDTKAKSEQKCPVGRGEIAVVEWKTVVSLNYVIKCALFFPFSILLFSSFFRHFLLICQFCVPHQAIGTIAVALHFCRVPNGKWWNRVMQLCWIQKTDCSAYRLGRQIIVSTLSYLFRYKTKNARHRKIFPYFMRPITWPSHKSHRQFERALHKNEINKMRM